MSVLVDTSVWSLALRRATSANMLVRDELRELVSQSRVRVLGPIRQEILSGIRDKQTFETLRERLGAFPDIQIMTSDYEKAAEMFNLCRAKGIQGSHIAFLICAVARHHDWEVFTTVNDFQQYAKIINVKIYRI